MLDLSYVNRLRNDDGSIGIRKVQKGDPILKRALEVCSPVFLIAKISALRLNLLAPSKIMSMRPRDTNSAAASVANPVGQRQGPLQAPLGVGMPRTRRLRPHY